MSVFRWCAIALCVGFSAAKVYEPCELAQELYETIRENAKRRDPSFAKVALQYLEDIPLLVCIAGYHNYTTDTTYTLRDGVLREGIFGIVRDPNTKESYVDDDITDDLWAFFSAALYIGLYRNTIAHQFYSQACVYNQNARRVYCYLNKYVFGNFPVLVPKNHLLLRMMYQTPQENRDYLVT